MMEKNEIAYFESKAQTLILYFNDLQKDDTLNLSIPMKARTPGVYTAPPSVAYPYYDEESQFWLRGDTLRINTSLHPKEGG